MLWPRDLGHSRSLKTTAFDGPHANVCLRSGPFWITERFLCKNTVLPPQPYFCGQRIASLCQRWLCWHGSSAKICGLTQKQNFRIRERRFDAKWNTENTESRYFEIPTTNTEPTWKNTDRYTEKPIPTWNTDSD